MPKHSLLFRLRRWFGLVEPELWWIRKILTNSPDPFDDMAYAVEVKAITTNTMRECIAFHRAEGMANPLNVPALIHFLEH